MTNIYIVLITQTKFSLKLIKLYKRIGSEECVDVYICTGAHMLSER